MTTIVRKLSSEIDQSLNFVFPSKSGSYFEARLVVRDGYKAVVYISSQDGCSQGCRMCYLTSLRQKKMTNAVLDDVLTQADAVLSSLEELNISARDLHFNFMARGDVVSNTELIQSWGDVERGLSDLVVKKNISTNTSILVSTIFPKKN